jgi:hypothetical protein
MAEELKITEEMLEKVALAQLYRDDPILELRKVISSKLTSKEMDALYKRILKDPRFEATKKDAIKLEEATLIDDDSNTIMLYYNKLLRDAQQEKKYEVAARILGEIRKLKAIDNEQTKFEIVFKIRDKDGTDTTL